MDMSGSDSTYHRLYAYLLSLLPVAKNYSREERVSNDEILAGKQHAPWHLVYYCRLIRLFIRGPQEKAMFAAYQSDISNLLIACDQNHYECDENKHEICILWALVLQGMPENVKWLARNERMINHMLDYYISIRPGEKFRNYNNTSLPPFYQIISLCCDVESFLDRVAQHRNFDWALRYLFMETGDYPLVATVIDEIIKKAAAHPKYRQRHIGMVLAYDKNNFSFEHLALFLDVMLQTPADFQYFCDKKGLDFLTKV